MSPIGMARLESGMRAVVAVQEAFNRHDLGGMMALLAPDCELEAAAPFAGACPLKGWQEIEAHYRAYFTARPGSLLETQEILGMGHRCVVRYRLSWLDAGGARVEKSACAIYREAGEKLRQILEFEKGGGV